jgi:diguanylate cyclase (GGDEF)-like protein
MLSTANGLANDFVRSIGEDREGNLWIGTNGGLVRMENGHFVGFTESQGLSGNFVRTVIEDSRGRILAGSDGGGLQEVSEGRVRPLPGAASLPSRFIRSLAQTPDALWVGTGDAGVVRLADGKVRTFGLADGLPSLATRMVLAARAGGIWVATDKGIARLDGGRFVRVEGPPALSGRVVALLEARDGTLWAGTYEQGLVGLKGASVSHLQEKDGLAGTTVFDLHEDDDGTLWVATASGLSRLKDGALRSLGTREGLTSPILFSVVDDGLGNFWFSSDQGVMRVPREDVDEVLAGRKPAVRCRLFGRPDGLPSRQCNGDNQPAAWRAKDGRLWFPTARGIAVVDPSKLAGGRPHPPVLVERLLVDGHALSAEGAQAVPRRSRRLEFEFAVLSFRSPESLSVRYRLEGFDDAWRDAGTLRKATYASLPPGEYVFRVSATSNEGWQGEASASLDVKVQPFLTETWAFRAGALAVGLAAGWGLFRALRRWQLRREERLNALIDAKTRDLAEAKERAEDANRRLEDLLRHDLLTGVANRLHFNEMLESEWRRAGRKGDLLAAAFFDIDHFKAYNDAFGHQAGDECLRRVATVLADGFRRAGSVVARWGGEEFVVLLPSSTLDGAESAAQRTLLALEALAIPHVVPTTGHPVTMSAGVAAIVPGEGTAEVLLAAADAALYEAKRQGRNRVVRSVRPPGTRT